MAGVSGSISDALRMHTASLPAGLRGHIVLVGGNTRLQYYILALRRQRPLKPIVVVTEDTVSLSFVAWAWAWLSRECQAYSSGGPSIVPVE